MRNFYMNGYAWQVIFVSPYSPKLVDRTGHYRLATTDPSDLCVYISNEVSDSMLTKVLIHELGHCAIFSFNLLPDIHRMVKRRYWVEAEEWICNFIADYGRSIFNAACDVIDNSSLLYLSEEIERFIA